MDTLLLAEFDLEELIDKVSAAGGTTRTTCQHPVSKTKSVEVTNVYVIGYRNEDRLAAIERLGRFFGLLSQMGGDLDEILPLAGRALDTLMKASEVSPLFGQTAEVALAQAIPLYAAVMLGEITSTFDPRIRQHTLGAFGHVKLEVIPERTRPELSALLVAVASGDIKTGCHSTPDQRVHALRVICHLGAEALGLADTCRAMLAAARAQADFGSIELHYLARTVGES